MKNLAIIFIFFSGYSAFTQDLWIQMDSLNGPERANATTFVIANNGYVVSGYDGSSKKRSMVSYDPIQNDWDNEESIGGSTGDGLNRSSAMGFQAYGFGFVCMGEGNGYIFSDLWMYDPFTETWSQMANFPGEARTQGVSFEIDNIGFVGLGKASDFATFLKDFWSYDYMSNSWTQVADFPGTSRIDAFGVRMGGKGYVGLGRDSTSFPNNVYEYYPVEDTWQQIADFPGTPRINTTSFARFPQLFITTGDDGFSYLNDTWEYNYFGDVWSQKTDFPASGRTGCISLTVDDRYFVGTGYGDGTYFDDFYEYVFVFGFEEQIQVQLNTFPNPSNGQFTLEIDQFVEDVEFLIYNELGQEISFQMNQGNGNKYQFFVDVPSLGTYFLRISKKNQVIAVQPIIVS